MISRKYKFIFIHIPKTGGTSIESFFGVWHSIRKLRHLRILGRRYYLIGWSKKYKIALQHITAKEMLSNNLIQNKKFQNYFKFTFVRNPWDRVISELRYRFGDKKINSNLIKKLLLDDWQGIDIRRHILPQYKFIYDEDEKLMVDFIGRFENLQKDFNKVCNVIGIKNNVLPHNKKTQHKHYSEYYNKETKNLVTKLYKKDIELFGYNFDKK